MLNVFKVQNQIFLRHYVKKFKKNGDKSKYSILYTPYLKHFAMLVSKQFSLYLHNLVGAAFISGAACLIIHYGSYFDA